MTSRKRLIKRRKNTTADPLQELAKKSGLRPANPKGSNTLAQPQTRWQRAVRYTWDKNRGRG